MEATEPSEATTRAIVRFAPKADKYADISVGPLSADFVAKVADEDGEDRQSRF